MFKFKFKIEKDRVYRAHRAKDVFSFSEWFYKIYMKDKPKYMFEVNESDKYIKFKLQTYAETEKEVVAAFLLKVITKFKEDFIKKLTGDLRVKYLDTQHKEHKETKKYMDIFMFDSRGEEVMSLFEYINGLKESFMSFELMVLPPDEDNQSGTSVFEEETEVDDDLEVALDFEEGPNSNEGFDVDDFEFDDDL